ncbi:hypothetical protein HED50_00280 [Ochrobactrum oryzae]|nr:hypothetical protein [Brucella oryzae]
MTTTDLRDQLIVGLDVPTITEAQKVVEELATPFPSTRSAISWFCGRSRLREKPRGSEEKVFLDMKLLDIDNTIAKGVENVAKMGVSMLTLHAYPKAMRAAVEAAKGSDLCLLGVTVLTSMDNADLREAGYSDDAETLVLKRARQAREAGMGASSPPLWKPLPSVRRSERTWPSSHRAFVPQIRKRRPEAGHDPCRCLEGRSQPPGRCAPDCRCGRPQSGSTCHSGGNALGCMKNYWRRKYDESLLDCPCGCP